MLIKEMVLILPINEAVWVVNPSGRGHKVIPLPEPSRFGAPVRRFPRPLGYFKPPEMLCRGDTIIHTMPPCLQM
jgi:hypothetical protein